MSGASPDSAAQPVASARSRWVAPLLVALAAVLSQVVALRGGLYEPDEILVLDLGQTYAMAPAGALFGAAEPDATAFPVRRWVELPLWTALHGLLGYDALAYRVLGVMLHALAALLVLLLARRLELGREPALIAGLLFAVYPKSWEVTALLSSMPWSIVTALLLGSLLLFLGRAQSRRPGLALAGSVALLVLAVLLRGAMAVLLPGVLLLVLVQRDGLKVLREGRALAPLAPHLLVALCGVVVIALNEAALTRGGVPPGDLDVLAQPGTVLWRLLVGVPASLLCLADPARLPGLTLPGVLWAAVVLGLVVGAVLGRRMPWRAASPGLFWLALMLVPLLIVVEPGGWGDARYFYTASAGLALALASVLGAVVKRAWLRRTVAAALLLLPAGATVAAQLDFYERFDSTREIAGSVAALARELPGGATLVLLEGGELHSGASEAGMLAAWLSRPQGLTVVQVEQPRVCAMPTAAGAHAATASSAAVYWAAGQLSRSDLSTAAAALAPRPCDPPPGPDDAVLARLPGDPTRALLGRSTEHPDFYGHAVRH